MDLFYQDEIDAQRVESLLNRFAPVLGVQPGEISYHLAYTSEVNAFCLIGGPMVITKGILQEMHDEELAFILAHELAHELAHGKARHGGEDLTKLFAVKAAGSLLIGDAEKLQKTADLKEAVMLEAFNLLAEVGFKNPYSRIQESEADAMAVKFLRKAGFSPENSIAALEKLMGENEGNTMVDRLFSTHPLTKDRIQRIRQFLEYDAQGGELLDSVQEDGQEMALDWHAETIEILNEVTVNTREVEGATSHIWFIPGIFMNKPENYLAQLEEAFPQSSITVVEWKAQSHTLLPYPQKLEYRARFFGAYLQKQLESEGEKCQNVVLMGHSLGSLAVAECCRAMNQKDMKVRQVILMAAAMPYDCQDLLTACEEASLEPTWNLYSYRDRRLKHVYHNSFRKVALGTCGAKTKQARMQEFLLDPPGSQEKIKDKATSHGFKRYLKGLQEAMAGNLPETTVKYDYHRIAAPKVGGFSIPRTGARVAESYMGWSFTYYLPGLPKFNLKFWKKKDKPQQETTEAGQEQEIAEADQKEETAEADQEKALAEALEDEEEMAEDTSPDALEKARRAKVFVIYNPLGEVCFYSLNFDPAYAKFTEIRETMDKVTRGEPYPTLQKK